MRVAAALLVACLLLATFTAAQSTNATVTGRVLDPTNAVIVGAKVEVINQGTNIKSSSVTGEEGIYVVPNLLPGAYRIEISKPNFKTIIKPDVVLHVQDVVALNFTLPVGSTAESVTVTGGAPLVNTESGAVATVVDRQFVGNLPLNGRSLQSLILLTPGVVLTESVFDAGQFSVNGQRGNANYFTVDGVSANIGVSNLGGPESQRQAGTLAGFSALGTTNTLVSIDALEEYRIQTSTYSADFGRQPGGQIALVTRSGTNQFHGTVFEYLRNDALDAREWFNKEPAPEPPLRQNQFGATFGGPVILPKLYDGRNRTFFFFSYEGLRLLLPTTANFGIPSLELRQAAPPALQPFLNMFPLPTGPETMVDDDFDPTTPDVPSGVAPFVGAYSSPSSMDATSIRIDHTFSSKLTVFGRFNEAPSSNLSRILSFLNGGEFHTRTLTLGANLSLSPRLNNDFRFNYSRNRGRQTSSMDDFGGAVPIDDPSVFVSGYSGPGTKRGLFCWCIAGSSFLGVSLGDSVDSYQRQINVVDNLSLVKGAHQLKFGVDYRRLAPIYGPVAYDQFLGFFSQADILSGTVSDLSIQASQGARPLFDNISAYAQDTWRVTPRLTLNLGVRWELNPAPSTADGIQPGLLTGVGENGDVSQAVLAPPGTPFYKTFYTAFAPRFGIAYQLDQARGRETVLRGGFGVYYDLGSGTATRGYSGFFGFTSLSNVPYPVPPALAVPPPVTFDGSFNIFAPNPNLQLPYTLQWNVALEQALGASQTVTLSYVASAARRQLTTQQLNVAPRDPLTGVSGPRPNPNFRNILLTSNGPTSDYHALQIQFERRLSRGLQALVNYTWSHAIDEVSNEVQTHVLERGNADFDVRHNFSAGVTYDIPSPFGEGVGKAVLGNWSLDSTVYAQSGPPVNLFAGLNNVDGRQVDIRPDVVPGVPFWIEDPTVPGGSRINPAAFLLPPRYPRSTFFAIRQGTLGRNVVRLPGKYQVNMALGRQFSFSERWKLQFKAEAFNLFNHPLFGQYGIQLEPLGFDFGVPAATLNRSLGDLNRLYQIGGPRSMQLMLRLSF
jgi:hypothetical protein